MNLSKLQEREKKSWTLKIFNCGHVYLEILSFFLIARNAKMNGIN